MAAARKTVRSPAACINACAIHTRTGQREREAERVGYIVLKLCHDINGTLLRSTPYIHTRWLAEIFIAFWSEYRWPAACYCRKSFDLFTAMVSIISSFLFPPFRFTRSIWRSSINGFHRSDIFRNIRYILCAWCWWNERVEKECISIGLDWIFIF